MKKEKIFFLLLFFLLSCFNSQAQQSEKLEPYINTLKEKGDEPIHFILDKLDNYGLILFDDALHTAVEPFEFYQNLIKNVGFQKKVKYIFLEAISVNEQPALDAYFNSEIDDLKLSYPAFQNDFSGTGWPYKTYFDLLQTIWKTNSTLPVQDRFKVVAVNAPTYWKEIDTQKDLDLFRLSLVGNDYTMYKIILSYLDNFKSEEKGIFLTNTRHAYKGIKNQENKYYWNCGTFFYLHNQGKTYSVRFHNINLSFEEKKEVDPKTPKTTEGLEDVIVKWVRMEKGLWDSAFEAFGNMPSAFDLKGTPFGNTGYIGNHMFNVASGQTMYDAYDALIFLAPVEKLHQTAMVDFIYTDEYKHELERRSNFLYNGEQINKILTDKGLKSLREFIDTYFIYKPEILQPLAKEIGPIDAWKTKNNQNH
ncbi:MAG: hypothetical protein AB7T22_08985 [Calditrichaceae bacterium]